MFDKRLAVTVAAITIVVGVAIVAALLPEKQASVPIQEPVTDVARDQRQPEEESAPPKDYLYIMKEFEGRVAIFGEDPVVPEIVLDKYVSHLPEYDQIMMKEGIKIHSAEELDARIEDYIS